MHWATIWDFSHCVSTYLHSAGKKAVRPFSFLLVFTWTCQCLSVKLPPHLLFFLRCAVLRVSFKAFLTHTWIKSFPNHFAVHLPPELGQIFCLLLFVVVYLLCFVLWHQAFCMISYWVFQFIISVVVDFVLPPTLFSTVKFTDHCSPKWSWWYCKYDCVTNGSLVAYV